MEALTQERPMAKTTESTKIDADVLANARIAASYAEKTVGKYISDLLRPIVTRDIEAGHAKKFGKPKPKGKPE